MQVTIEGVYRMVLDIDDVKDLPLVMKELDYTVYDTTGTACVDTFELVGHVVVQGQ